ncbi:MAG: zinc-binding dehydrogenase [Phycisphaerales bacterium]
MNALVIQRGGSPVAPNVQFVSDWPDVPDAGALPPGHAIIRTLATALNHLDLWVGKGVPGLDLTYPRISGCDACGVVEALAAGVDPTWIGKRVVVNAASPAPVSRSPLDPTDSALAPAFEVIGEHHNGMHRERFIAPVANLAVVRGDQDPLDAAAFALTHLTAYSMMVTKAGLLPGQRVLITGIGGGVALAALNIAKWKGCQVVVTSRHQSKLDRAAELGADFGVLDTGQDWSREVRAWAGKARGVELAVDSSGKATHLKCLKSLGRGGAYVTPGCTSGPDATTDLARIFWNQLRIIGSTMGSNDELAEIGALFRIGVLKPVVDHVVPARRGAEAFARLESGEQFGKVVIDWR